MIKNTDYVIGNKTVSYEIGDNEYYIYLGGNKWIHQYEGNFPYTDVSIEECCINQIKELVEAQNTQSQEELNSENVKTRLEEMQEALDYLLMNE